ncbi:hypothetical protein NC653_034583 [Populus alba x Populus x berolinensis]|uniref:Uncharacterized protein n=1 Tax=Populus alba x Populus x berolinensis TaxID=444605 RepID=A0AAD6LMZ6_9ROSI|nr:hypothetical protein NC653_034583 [Populus alba x Populus x berolinensis]
MSCSLEAAAAVIDLDVVSNFGKSCKLLVLTTNPNPTVYSNKNRATTFCQFASLKLTIVSYLLNGSKIHKESRIFAALYRSIQCLLASKSQNYMNACISSKTTFQNTM